MVRLTEIYQEPMSPNVRVRQVFVNPAHVVMVREDITFSTALHEGRLNHLSIEPAMNFSRISVRNSGTGNYEITVFGDAESIYEKIRTTQKALLKG